jgi:hypothetical protein
MPKRDLGFYLQSKGAQRALIPLDLTLLISLKTLSKNTQRIE